MSMATGKTGGIIGILKALPIWVWIIVAIVLSWPSTILVVEVTWRTGMYGGGIMVPHTNPEVLVGFLILSIGFILLPMKLFKASAFVITTGICQFGLMFIYYNF